MLNCANAPALQSLVDRTAVDGPDDGTASTNATRNDAPSALRGEDGGGTWPMGTWRLGEGQAGATGVEPGGLLRACAVHHAMLARGAIESVVMEGPLAAFRKADLVTVSTHVEPTLSTGWRSVVEVVPAPECGRPRAHGAALNIQLVSDPTGMGGGPNGSCDPSSQDRGVDEPRAVRAIRARAARLRRAARRVAGHGSGPVERVVRPCDLAPRNRLDPVSAFALALEAERSCVGGRWALLDECRREMHLYAPVDPGELLRVHCAACAVGLAPDPCVESLVAMVRASDGAVVAACETRLA